MEDRPRNVKDSFVELTELVFPNDANAIGNLFGGQLMHWVDICAAISATRHARRLCITASVDEISFLNPINVGEVVILNGRVNRAFTTSMEVGVEVYSENLYTGKRLRTNVAYLTFVAVDENRKPVPVPPIIPETDDEKERYDAALQRRTIRLQHRTKK